MSTPSRIKIFSEDGEVFVGTFILDEGGDDERHVQGFVPISGEGVELALATAEGQTTLITAFGAAGDAAATSDTGNFNFIRLFKRLLQHASSLIALWTAQSYALLTNASATGANVAGVREGSYIWSINGTWGGATATLRVLADDGVTWLTVDTATANKRAGVVMGKNATVSVAISGGAPSGLYSGLS